MNTQSEKTIEKSNIATFSLIIGIVSFLGAFFIPILGLLGGLVAIILGVLALREIKAQGFQGRGAAITGIVLGGVGIAWFLIFTFVLGPAIADTFNQINDALQ